MEGLDPFHVGVAVVAASLGVYALARGRQREDTRSQGIGVVLLILTFLVPSPGPLGFFTLVLAVGLFSEEIQKRWTAAGKPAKSPPKKGPKKAAWR